MSMLPTRPVSPPAPPTTVRRPRILFLRTTGFFGGPERQIHRHAALNRHGPYEIIVGSFLERGRIPELILKSVEDGVPIQTFEVASGYDPRAILRLRRYLIDSRIDILCTHDYRSSVIGCLAVAGTECRWIAFSRGWTDEGAKVHIFQSLEKLLSRFADRVIAVSQGQALKLRQLSLAPRTVSVVYNSVDPAEFAAVQPIDLRQRFNLPTDAIVAMSAGRFTQEKGQNFLVRAAPTAIAQNPRLHFVLFGDGAELQRIRQSAQACGCGPHVLFPGFEKSVVGCMKGADMIINPSLSEGLPNVVLEAMAVNTPVIATAVGGVPELITHEHDGLLVPPADPDALSAAILRLAESPAERQCLSRNALETVTRRFSFDTQNARLHEIYRQVLDGLRDPEAPVEKPDVI